MPARNYRQKTTGKTVKGTTTILGILNKPVLLWWAYKQGMSNFERLMGDLVDFNKNYDGGLNQQELSFLIQNFKTTGLYDKRDKAANAGILGHLFVENYLKKLPEPDRKGLPEDVILKAEGCYLTFLDFEKSNSMNVFDSEIELTSELYPFGGTIDHIITTGMTPPNSVEILDLKTGKDIYFEAKIQIKSYGKLWEEHHPELPVAGFHILRLGENGEFTHKYFPSLNEGYFKIFLNLLEVTELLSQLGEKL